MIASTKYKSMLDGKTIAFVHGGGGADGGYQAQVLYMLEQQFGIRANYVAGISTGALTGSMQASGKTDRLVELYDEIREEDISIMRSHLGIAQRIGLHKLGIGRILGWAGLGKAPLGMHDNSPLEAMIRKEIDFNSVSIPLKIGRVSLKNGAYATHISEDNFHSQVLASTAIPVIWPPTAIEGELWVDGGVYNVNPLSDVLPYQPDLIFVLPTSPYPLLPVNNKEPDDWIDVGVQTYGLNMNRSLESDYNRFLDVNHFVGQAEQHGIQITNRKGRPMKSFESLILSPRRALPGALDFSLRAKKFRKAHAEEVFREVYAVQIEAVIERLREAA